MNEAKDFVRVLKQVSKTTSKDATRYHMCGVFVQRLENGYIQFQASDGYCYVNRTENLPEVNELMKTKGYYWFHYDQIKVLSLKTRSIVLIEPNNDELTIKSDSVSITSEPMQNRPGFESIEPSSLISGERTHVDVCFNPDLLLAVREAMATGKSSGITLRIPIDIRDDGTLKHNTGAMLAKNESGIGLIMPMRQ